VISGKRIGRPATPTPAFNQKGGNMPVKKKGPAKKDKIEKKYPDSKFPLKKKK